VRICDKLHSSLHELQVKYPKKAIAGLVDGRHVWRLSWEAEDDNDDDAVFSVPSITFKMQP
jgi:hypothetical protein